jgi:hypothetical protein
MWRKSKDSFLFVCLSSRCLLFRSPSLCIPDRQADRQSNTGEARKQRRSDLNGQIKIWQVQALSSVCHINKSWQNFKNHLLGALYSGQLLAQLWNIQVVGTLLKASQKTDSNVSSRSARYQVPYRKILSLTEHTLTYTGSTTYFQCACVYLGNTKHIFFYLKTIT